jgi:hypothetical protein
MVLTLDQEFGVQEVGVHKMRPGQEAPLLPRGVDRGRRRSTGRRADRGVDIGEQVR